MSTGLETKVDEIAPAIFRLSTWVSDISEQDFTFNQSLPTGGRCPALTESDCVAPELEAESLFHATGLTTNLVPTLEQLAQLTPTTLALMHGASFTGDGAGQLRGLSDGYASIAG
jgi:hypothetical protein